MSKQTMVKDKEYYRKWRKEHPDYFKKYYKKNRKQVQESNERYRKSTKGKTTIKKYEQSEKRMAYKRAYQKMLRDAKKKLDSLKKRGLI